MEQKTEFIVDMLTVDSVSILQKPYFEFGGNRFYGENVRNAFLNSADDRKRLQEILPEAQYKAVMAVWGDTSTISEKTPE